MERRFRLSKKRNRSKVKACVCVCVIYFLIGKDVMDLAHLLSARRSMSRFTLDLTNTIVNHNIYPISATFYFLFPRRTFLHHSHGNPVVTILRIGTISNLTSHMDQRSSSFRTNESSLSIFSSYGMEKFRVTSR